jgi:DNA-binding response OmpR family regulator
MEVAKGGTFSYELLIIDDHPPDVALLLGLAAEGFHVSISRSGEEGVAIATTHRPAAIIVHSELPDLSGLAVLRLLSSTGVAPVLFRSESDDEEEVVLALEMGAVDFLRHPIRVRECAARIWSAIRRGSQVTAPDIHRPTLRSAGRLIEKAGPVEVNLARREVSIRGHRVHARPKEIDLLALLVSNAGHVVSREEALSVVWSQHGAERGDSLDVHIRRIRSMVEEDLHRPRHIITVRGYGHRFDP